MSQQNHSDSGQFSKILILKFTLGSWHQSTRLTLEGGEVMVTPAASPPVIAYSPSNEEWNEFLESLERLDVASWEESYNDSSILDGTQWHFQIRTESFEIYTGGSNAYPENFNGLIMSINKLISFDDLFTLETKSGSREDIMWNFE